MISRMRAVPVPSSFLPSGFLPLIERADHRAPSVFRPENMMREARRQKGLDAGPVPRVVLLDPDGDMVDYVRAHFGARPLTLLGLLPHGHVDLERRKASPSASSAMRWGRPSPCWWRSRPSSAAASC